jgi:two-component system NtrC family sensor kinase
LIQDITERKQMETQLIESDRLAAIGVLAGGIGHEINNPLAWVMTHLRTVHGEISARAESGDPILARWAAQLDEALQGSDRVRQIVKDLAFFTRHPETESAPIDLRAALDWAADMAMSELRHRTRFTKRYDPAPLVSAPEARLGQVFLNLLINAAQSIDEGPVDTNEVRVELSTDEKGRARVDVSDTGAGISPEHVPRVFDPFFTTKPRGVGTGLGLSVSLRIVQSLGGSLEVVTARAGDTRFRVTLPSASAELAELVHPSTARARLTRRLRVLVIDDQPSFLVSLRLAMQELIEIHEEGSARAALARLRKGEHFDAIVCDLMMPDLSGMDFHDQLSSDLPSLLPKVIYMTGGAYTPKAREFLQSVSNASIEKPFLPEELEALLARL